MRKYSWNREPLANSNDGLWRTRSLYNKEDGCSIYELNGRLLLFCSMPMKVFETETDWLFATRGEGGRPWDWHRRLLHTCLCCTFGSSGSAELCGELYCEWHLEWSSSALESPEAREVRSLHQWCKVACSLGFSLKCCWIRHNTVLFSEAWKALFMVVWLGYPEHSGPPFLKSTFCTVFRAPATVCW